MKMVYLIEAASGEIKIGCSKDPWRRLFCIAANAPCGMSLIAQWPGSHADEFELHRRFKQHQNYREWYRNEGDLTAFVNQRRGLNINAEDAPGWARGVTLPVSERRRLFAQRQSNAPIDADALRNVNQFAPASKGEVA